LLKNIAIIDFYTYIYTMSRESSPDLFDLIKSLNSSEKGYFKKFASRHTIEGKSHYVKLFDAIPIEEFLCEKNLSYTEKQLFHLYLFSTIPKQLSVFSYQ